jgi:hypothetical protein
VARQHPQRPLLHDIHRRVDARPGLTEVFDFSHRPYSKEEMAITGILDRLLGEVLFSKKARR